MHQDSRENDNPVYGPLRRAPQFYAGEHFGRHRMQHADVTRNANGSLPGIRNKAARRIIRKAFAAKVSRVEQGLRRTRELKAQAREVIADEHYEKSSSAQMRRARKLLAAELSIHQPVYAPTGPELRAMRTAKRKEMHTGKKDFITAAIEQIVEGGDRVIR